MSFSLNDPAGVQALLDQIRSSSAWQELSAASVSSRAPEPTPVPREGSTKDSVNNALPTPSVASLLSQLRPTPGAQQTFNKTNVNAVKGPLHQELASPTKLTLPTAHMDTSAPARDFRSLNFEESIPILLQLSHEPAFLQDMKKIKRDQDALERQLWEERRSVHKKYEERLKAAKTKATITGSSISRHDAEMLADSHKKGLLKFDNERALPAWDSLLSQQQLKLQRLQVPTMHVTSDSLERELQQRVLQVLISIIDLSDG